MEITMLVPKASAAFSLERPTGTSNPGGGMGVKYARLEQMLSSVYSVRRTSKVEEVDTDFVMVEPLWVTWVESMEWLTESLERLDALLSKKIKHLHVCGSEQALYVWPEKLRAPLVKAAKWITHSSRYVQRMYQAVGIPNSLPLCDPVSELTFYPVPKQNRIYTSSHVSWQKGIREIVELYRLLQDSDIETVYCGSAQTWGSLNVAETTRGRYQLEAELREVTDVYLGDVSPTNVAYYANACRHHVHTAHHDASSQNQQEGALAGCTLWGLEHPLNTDRPVRQYGTVEDLAQALIEFPFTSDYDEEVRAYAMRQFSYTAGMRQFHEMLRCG